jgi:hypothetical protein
MNRFRPLLAALLAVALTAPAFWIAVAGPGLAAPSPIPLPSIQGLPPSPDTLPGGSHPADPGARQEYFYDNPAEALRVHENEPAPDDGAAQIAALSPQAEKAGTWEHCLKRWLEYKRAKAEELAAGKQTSPQLSWRTWLRRYIPNQGNGKQGTAFVLHLAQRLRLGANHGWRSEVYVPEADRYYDLGNDELHLLYEAKSGRSVDDGELAKDKKFMELEKAKPEPRRLVYLFPEEPTAGSKTKLSDAGVPYFVVPALKKLRKKGGDPGGAPDLLRGPDQRGSQGVALDAVADSPDTAQEAAEVARVDRQLAVESGHPEMAQDLGGVDFSTLELRYVADTYRGGSGLQYAFRADSAPEDRPSYGGRRTAQMASDAFFVWLALAPSVFTVNLSPDEPDRILDPRLARTDAGRVLLEADLLMKKMSSRLTHPDTALGRRYWEALRGEGDEICVSNRQWIVPEPAIVREDRGRLYILDAPLTVKMETEYFKTQTAAGQCRVQSPDISKHNELVHRTMILPEIVKAVNSSPEFADLRRVYLSRVAAQWYRERSAKKPTAHSALIDSGDVSRWPSREQWSPQEVYQRFIESYTKGEYNLTRTTERFGIRTVRTYIHGGVDFTNILRTVLSAASFQQRWPTLAATVDRAGAVVSFDRGGRDVWLGGETTALPLSELPAGSPVDKTYFYVWVLAPMLVWLAAGIWLWSRRRRRRYRPAPIETRAWP